MSFGKYLCLFCGGVFAMTGCVSTDDPSAHSLTLQQSATIESLNSEILRLNQELEGTFTLRKDLQTAMLKVEAMFLEQIARGDVRVVLDPRGLVVTVLDRSLFDPDTTQLTLGGKKTLEKISAVLSRDLPKNRVDVEGHADDKAVEGADGITSWEYSISRATAVLHYFIDIEKLAPGRFGISGYAEYKPADSNAAEAGRDHNRRVEIVIEPRKVSSAPVR